MGLISVISRHEYSTVLNHLVFSKPGATCLSVLIFMFFILLLYSEVGGQAALKIPVLLIF